MLYENSHSRVYTLRYLLCLCTSAFAEQTVPWRHSGDKAKICSYNTASHYWPFYSGSYLVWMKHWLTSCELSCIHCGKERSLGGIGSTSLCVGSPFPGLSISLCLALFCFFNSSSNMATTCLHCPNLSPALQVQWDSVILPACSGSQWIY